MDDEPDPPMAHHLFWRATIKGDMAGALYFALQDAGLRLPSRRDLAGKARISEATVSRRLRDWEPGEERLVAMLAKARQRTYPLQAPKIGTWERWLPQLDCDLKDVRAWLACLALAPQMPRVSEAVLLAWEHEYAALVRRLVPWDQVENAGEAVMADVTTLHALALGLSIRRLLDPELTFDVAVGILRRAVSALGHDGNAA